MILNYQSDYLNSAGTAEIQAYVERLSQLAGFTVRRWARLADLEELLQLVVDLSFVRKETRVNGSPLGDLHINDYKIIKMLSTRQIDILSHNHPCLKQANFRGVVWSILGHLTQRTIINFPGLYPGSLGLLAVASCLSGTEDVIRFFKGCSIKIQRYSMFQYSREPGLVCRILSSELSDLLVSFPSLVHGMRLQAQRCNADAPAAEYIIPPTLSSIQFPESWKMKAVERLTLRDELTVPNPIEYLTSGTWAGYHTYGFIATPSQIRPPMRAIKFEVTKDMSSSVEVRAMNAREKGGRFNISLEVSKKDGHFHGEKKDESNNQWKWYGMVTPFGVFAGCGMGWYDGHIWLWKDR